MRRVTILAIAVALSGALAGFAEARTTESAGVAARPPAVTLSEYPVPLGGRYWGEGGITAGPDGAMWFTAVSGN